MAFSTIPPSPGTVGLTEPRVIRNSSILSIATTLKHMQEGHWVGNVTPPFTA